MAGTRSSRWQLRGSSRVRRAGLVALALLLGSVFLALFLAHRYHRSVADASIAIVIGGGTLSAVYLAWVTYRDSQTTRDVLPVAALADELAAAVGSQWEREAAVRRLNDPYPLPVRWVPVGPPASEEWEGLVALASSGAGWPSPAREWAGGPAELAGHGNQLADVLERVPTHRLVVLGEPGSGKTMLMVRLILDLLQRRSPGDVVPVLISAASWNPVAQDFHSWLISQLLIAHPALAGPASPSDAGDSRVEALLRERLLMPILDGFDELPGAVRGPAIVQITDQLRPGERLVMTSRTEEYLAATHPAAGPEITPAAAAIELSPLDTSDVITYLRQAAGGSRSASRWDAVFAALTGQGPLGQVLSNPLMVGLARTIYNPRPGELSGALQDPAKLCLLSTKDSIEDHLLDAFIPASYRLDNAHRSTCRKWTIPQAEKWLSFLAYDLDQDNNDLAFSWWDLTRASKNTTALVSGIIAGIAVGVPVLLIPLILPIALIVHDHKFYFTNPHHVLQFLHGYYEFFPLTPSAYYYHGYWGWVAKIVISYAIAGGVSTLFVAIGPRRDSRRQSAIAYWSYGNITTGRILFGLIYGLSYCMMIFVTIDFTFGWPRPSTVAGAIWLGLVLAVGFGAALGSGDERFRMATVAVILIGGMVGVPFLLYRYSGAGYAAGLPAGLAAGVAVMARGQGRYYPSRAIRWRPRSGIAGGIMSGIVVGVVTEFATSQISVAWIFGIVIGLGAMVVVGLERIPGDLEASVSPLQVLRRDRSATLTLTLVTAVAAGLAVGLGTFLETGNLLGFYYVSPVTDAVVFGLSIGPAVGFAFGFALSGYGSAWPQWIFAREALAIRRQVPQRLMTFLADAHERGVLRQVGPVYQFRHIELQRRLASRVTRKEAGRLYLNNGFGKLSGTCE